MRILNAVAMVLLSGLAVRAADRIPVEDFARLPTFSNPTLSPDGRTCGFLKTAEGRQRLFFVDVATSEIREVGVGRSAVSLATREVGWYRWIGPNRLAVGLRYWSFLDGMAAFDRDGKDWKPLSGYVGLEKGLRIRAPDVVYAYQLLHVFNDDKDVLALDMGAPAGKERFHPDVIRINTRTGAVIRVTKNPGQVTAWLADQDGCVRVGVSRQGEIITLIHRADEKRAWTPLNELSDGRILLEGFRPDGRGIYLTASDQDGYRAFYCFDLDRRQLGEPLMKLSGYDLQFDNSEGWAGAVWSPKRRTVVGYRYMAEKPGAVWLDAELARQMAAIDQALPETFNTPVSFSDDGGRLLVQAASDREPGAYYLFDPEKFTLTPIMRQWPWLKPAQMAPMHPIKFTVRDGLEIHGYLTIPVGEEPRNLPLVVMPHDGPRVRDMWKFDPMVQMLANRGYAVLQMNPRGSEGYGAAFAEKGRNETGGAIQRDIEDATRWALAQNIADPKRIAIMGRGQGGYSALFALAKSPGLYCCGISLTGVTDWPSLFKSMREPEKELMREQWTRDIGVPEQDEERLRAISPVNFAKEIAAPVLIVQRKDDRVVPLKQAKAMIAALQKAGRQPESLFLADEWYAPDKAQAMLEEFQAVETFLARHLAAESGLGTAQSGKNP